MSGQLDYATHADLGPLAELVGHAFGVSAPDTLAWFTKLGESNLRVLREGTRPQASLAVIPMGQYYGGRAVPTWGVAGVAVAPEARGGGLGTRLMCELIRHGYAQEWALSSLYPATLPVYGRAGYERAGALLHLEFAPAAMAPRSGPRLAVESVPGEQARLQDLYERWARTRPGHLQRCPYIWDRVFQPRGQSTRTVLFSGEDGPEGYLVVSLSRQGDSLKLTVTDAVALTPAAWRTLLATLRTYKSVVSEAVWRMAGPDSSVFMLNEKGQRLVLEEYWMVRLVHLQRAFADRGYPGALSGELHLDIEDDVVAENCGRWRLRFEQGRAALEAGGRGHLRLGIRALAALYTGFLPWTCLAECGLAEARDGSWELAQVLFAGPAPTCPDFY